MSEDPSAIHRSMERLINRNFDTWPNDQLAYLTVVMADWPYSVRSSKTSGLRLSLSRRQCRAPYGTRGFDTVYAYTLQCGMVFSQGCQLVILACNTASAKALRTIQQNDLPKDRPDKKCWALSGQPPKSLGIYPNGACRGYGNNQHGSFRFLPIEIAKFFPGCRVEQEACPMWVPLIENNEHHSPGADYFVKQHIVNLLSRDGQIDCILPWLAHIIRCWSIR